MGLVSWRLLVVAVLVLSAAVRVSRAQGCPSGPPGCACPATFLTCNGAGLTRFPALPVTVQQRVEEVDLQSNDIASILAEDLENYTSLITLRLSFNQISLIEPGSFANTPQLRQIYLNGNQLREIPDDLFANTQLRTLDLSQNMIQNISAATFTGLTVPSTILLSNNIIRTIPNDTFLELGFIQTLNLDRNPLRCDCELRWFPSFLSSLSSLTTVMAGSCNAPPLLSGTNVNNLTESQFVCNCDPPCVNGTCDLLVGNCECEDGYIGEDCATACPPGTYGAGCQGNCTCVSDQESTPCDNVQGTCFCLPGYTGASCESECPDGFYGQDCLEQCQCQNGASCDFITGMCNCTIGWTGVFCNMMCPPGRYGLGCVEECTCETGNCHHITGDCSCPVGFFGTNCSHNCTGAPDCSDLGRGPCSLDTPEQTCSSCLPGHVGEQGDGNTQCILCSGAPNCAALNRYPCSEVPNTCGRCFPRHLGVEGFSNESCFDPCVDGIMNYNETDVDCGGSLCPSCELGDSCTSSEDCGSASVCLGLYVHPSQLDYPFNVRDNNTCVAETSPGSSILQRFKDALAGRVNPLPNVSPLATRNMLEEGVDQELQIQFLIPEQLESIEITELNQAPGNPLYQTKIRLSEVLTEERVEESFERMVENMDSGRLKGTLLLNKEDKRALFNF